MSLIPLVTEYLRGIGYKMPTSPVLLAILEDPWVVMESTLNDKLALDLGPIKIVIYINRKVEVVHEAKVTTIQSESQK